VATRREGTAMSTMRDAGFVLVLLLLAATIRVDQPVKATVMPEAQAAAPAAAAVPVEMPAVDQIRAGAGTLAPPKGRTCGMQREVRVVRLGGLVKALDLKELPTIVLDSAESQMRFVFVEGDTPKPRLTVPVTVG
jgi:hypothetical protein